MTTFPLKVHKIENFFGFDFGKILPKFFFDWAIIGGDTIFPLSLRLGGIKLA